MDKAYWNNIGSEYNDEIFDAYKEDRTGKLKKCLKKYSDKNHDAIDVGCGTGILAILASKLGAQSLLGFDIDEWAVENTAENFAMNGLGAEAEVFKGTINEVPVDRKFGGILANINRNILLDEIPKYVSHLLPGGWLVTSGFYEMDQADIESCGAENGLTKLRSNTRNQWATVIFEKNK